MDANVNKEKLLTYELACALFRYEKETGFLFWKKQYKCRKLHKRIGNVQPSGHLLLCMGFNGKKYNFFVHRVVWLMHHGVWPHPFIDHINCKPDDNRIENLRIATTKQNSNNRGKSKKEGFKGVYVLTPGKTFRVRAKVDGKQKHIGTFKTELEAHEAYIEFAKNHYGEFARG
jgi:hypothetical protein